jgi:hypothetical protein
MTIDDLMEDLEQHHSTLQMDHFITASTGMTLYGCYRQSLRELFSRRAALRDSEWQVRKWQRKVEQAKSPEKREYLEAQLVDINHELGELRREFERFEMQARALRAALEDEGYSFPLSKEDKDKLGREMWVVIIKAAIAVDIMTTGRPGAQVLEKFRCLPAAMKQELWPALQIENKEWLMNWFLNYDPPRDLLRLSGDAENLTIC